MKIIKIILLLLLLSSCCYKTDEIVIISGEKYIKITEHGCIDNNINYIKMDSLMMKNYKKDIYMFD